MVDTIHKRSIEGLASLPQGVVALYSPAGVIIIRVDKLIRLDGMISTVLNHERSHHIQVKFPHIYANMLSELKNEMGFRDFSIAVDETNRDRWGFDLATEEGMKHANVFL